MVVNEQHPQAKKRPLWKRLLRTILFSFVLIVDVIGLSLTLMSLGWLVVGDSNLFTWHFSSLMPGIIALTPFVVVIGLLGRRRWSAFYIIPAMLFIGLYGAQFIPFEQTIAEDTQLRVMTYNTRFVSDDAHQLVEVILEADVDVVALQELSEPAADYFEEHLKDEYPYQITYTDGVSVKGKGLLSRYPLENHSLERISGNNLLRAEFSFDGEVITIINAHPSPPGYGINFNSHNREKHIDWIMEQAEDSRDTLILLGDFNTTQHSDDYAQITTTYHDSFRDVGWGLGQTFPDGQALRGFSFLQPLIRIDYVFHNDGLRAVSSQVWHTSGGSDHRPVITAFNLK